MLVGACLEALVGIGDASSLAAIRRRFPDLAALPDFLLASCLKAIGALGSAREFAEVASLLPVRGPHLRPAILGALIAIHQRCPLPDPGEACCRPYGRWWKMETHRCAAIRRCGFWASGPTRDDVYAFPRLLPVEHGTPGSPGSGGNSSGDRTARGGARSCGARARRIR